jgi:hypothetical protein
MRAIDLARHFGVSRCHFYRHWRRELIPYHAGGKVVVYSTVEAEALIRNGKSR